MAKRRNTRRTNAGGGRKHRGTRRSGVGHSGWAQFNAEAAEMLLGMLMMIKLFHWKTHSYAAHKASDELYAQMNLHMDSFVEIMLGKTGARIQLPPGSVLQLADTSSNEALRAKVDQFKSWLVSLEQQPALRTMSNTDLFNIRDTILGDLNQFLYLLTFQ